MNPMIPIAVDVLPDLARWLMRDKGGATRDLVVSIVSDVLKTDEPAEARRRAQDPQNSAELRIRLAELANEAEAREFSAEQAARQAQLDTLQAQLAAEGRRREVALKQLQTRLADRADARGTFGTLAEAKSPFAWGPVVVSIIVTAGFFLTLVYLIRGGFRTAQTDPVVFQVVNIAVGALTAGFATVVSFWLGSSDGSRRKDITAERVQSDNVRATREIVSEQSRQTADLIERVVAKPVPAPAARAVAPAEAAREKDARQFKTCVETVFAHEGGFVDHPDDPGGATNMGITHTTLAAWRGEAVTVEDVRILTRAEAAEIYRANYWNALSCDGLPAGVDLVVFDFGVNAGVGRSAKLLQRLVHVDQDGQVGPITLGAARGIDPVHVIEAFSDGRMDHYRSLRHWETFKNGWTRRTQETRDAALRLARA